MKRLRHWPGHAWLALAARWYLGVVFLLACLQKIAHPGDFALTVATYDILPLSLVNLLAICLPFVELACAVLLLSGLCVRGAALLVSLMMIMFLTALSIALFKGLDVSCGCFAAQGAAEDPISIWTLVRDLAWLLLSTYVMIFDSDALGLDRWLNRRKREKVHEP